MLYALRDDVKTAFSDERKTVKQVAVKLNIPYTTIFVLFFRFMLSESFKLWPLPPVNILLIPIPMPNKIFLMNSGLLRMFSWEQWLCLVPCRVSSSYPNTGNTGGINNIFVLKQTIWQQMLKCRESLRKDLFVSSFVFWTRWWATSGAVYLTYHLE